MTRHAPLCPRCSRRCMDLGRYSVDGRPVWLCLGCVADLRREGVVVRRAER